MLMTAQVRAYESRALYLTTYHWNGIEMAYNQALQDGNVTNAHGPTVGPNLPMTVNNKPQSSDPSLTTTDHLRLLPPPPQCKFSHWPDFSSDFPPDPPICRAMGRQLYSQHSICYKITSPTSELLSIKSSFDWINSPEGEVREAHLIG